MPAADVRFVSLADALRPRQPAVPEVVEADVTAIEMPSAAPSPIVTIAEPAEQRAAVQAARLFGAAIADAVDGAVADLIRELAIEVVARELRLAKADVAAIARRLIAERLDLKPVRLRVAAGDAGIPCDLPITVDPTLEPGDAILECRDGTIDARLGIRLAAVLAAVLP